MFILLLLLVVAIFYYFASPEERTRAIAAGIAAAHRLKDAAIAAYRREDPFRDVLRERTPWPVVVPAIVLLNVVMYLRVAFGAEALAGPEALVAWGASFGPRTTNGEWWRLLASSFVHAGLFATIVDMAGLVAVGVALERIVGHVAMAVVYLAGAVLGSLVCLSSHPMGVTFGSTAAVLSVYGLFTSTLVWLTLEGSPLKVPVATLKRVAPAAGVFLLSAAMSGGPQASGYLPGLFTGFVVGLVLARGASERKPPLPRLLATAGTALAILVASAVPLRGVADVRPEIARVVSLEDRLARAYARGLDEFRRGVTSAEALARVIDRSVTPEIETQRARLTGLAGVPPEHEAMVSDANEYLRLRDESWRLRAAGLRKSEMGTLRKADAVEKAALDAFEKLRSAGAAPPPVNP
jgi:membrane associated rhomboid family serine protease